MALFIRDAEVDALTEEVRKLTKTKTMTEAVRQALRTQLAQARRTVPVSERLARSKALADAVGLSDPAFDMKAYTDNMRGDA
jgi:antitoxin VapB